MKEYELKKTDVKTGETLAYRTSETQGETVLLLHGNMSSSVHFQPLVEQLEKDFNVYALDLVGFGDSTYNRQLESLEDFSRDVQAFIKQLDLKDINILGWSTGGGIALEVAAALPDRIRQVFLLNSVGLQGYKMYKKGPDYKPVLTERIYKREEIEKDPVQVLPVLHAYNSGNKDMIKQIWEAAIYNLNKPQEEDYEVFIDAVMKQRNLVDVDVSLTQFNITHDFNGVVEGSGRMENIQAPIVIIHGEKDMIVPVEEAHQSKKFLSDQAELIIIEDVGHSIITDDLNELTEIIAKHIKE
ncbi:Pimeloyl-ACP methyl ester carboxylesterase [Alkalibacterium putridalgicola]|uniref:3-oxoadipate enol-lactonase n=1 Tax=Alkalibacterium putridalgicola TaxID=426703 RepID=A0A1H7VY45_9LACT|nr:alpha/beta hydrolase [Alkalibacterium putridalgicola]GEK89379.1 3-oxoadipate enol-lactonase [Alkalibacterium putridalgicola]SEM13708.1 Pimeloyl-ACP methyl ester carboxylesterase [Alkalibacterium putridalgicola]